MTLEERLISIGKEYGKEAEEMWRNIVGLKNFKPEYLTDDKIFLCIFNRGFMARAGQLGLAKGSSYIASLRGKDKDKLKFAIYGGTRDVSQNFVITVNENGDLVFDKNYERMSSDGYDLRESNHENEIIKIGRNGEIIYGENGEICQYTSDHTKRIIETNCAEAYDRETGIKTFIVEATKEQRERDEKLTYYDSFEKKSKLNPDFATVSSSYTKSTLVDGKIEEKSSSETSLYSGDYIPMDDFHIHSFLEKTGTPIELGPQSAEIINKHRLKLAENTLKRTGKLPIGMIEQLPDDIKKNLGAFKQNIRQQEVSVSTFNQIYNAIMQYKEGPDKMNRMTGNMQVTLNREEQQKNGQNIGQEIQ